MAFNYNESVILWSYHKDQPDQLTPSFKRLENFDRQMFKRYDKALVEAFKKRGIPISRETKSRVLLLTLLSNGDSVDEQVRDACTYYVHVWTMDLNPPV